MINIVDLSIGTIQPQSYFPVMCTIPLFLRLNLISEDAIMSHGDIVAVFTMGFNRRMCLQIIVASTIQIRFLFNSLKLTAYQIWAMFLQREIINSIRGCRHFCPASSLVNPECTLALRAWSGAMISSSSFEEGTAW